mgnify:CR=1 FL=1
MDMPFAYPGGAANSNTRGNFASMPGTHKKKFNMAIAGNAFFAREALWRQMCPEWLVIKAPGLKNRASHSAKSNVRWLENFPNFNFNEFFIF